jgi:hypothetical protein
MEAGLPDDVSEHGVRRSSAVVRSFNTASSENTLDISLREVVANVE